jgi:hypothetical protein
MKRRVLPPRPEYIKFLSPFGERITELALATRRLVLEEAPEATELIYDAYSAVSAGYSFTGRPSDAFIHIAAYSKRVNLGFNFGVLLEDPDGLLEGAGRWIRHIPIAELPALKKPGVRTLVRSAIAAAERPKEKVKPASVVRAIYARKRRPIR